MDNSSFESDLRISHRWLIALLLLLGLVFFFVGELQSEPADRQRVRTLAFLCLAMPILVWAIDGWKPHIGRLAGILSLALLIVLGDRWFGVPGIQTLMAVPVALAAALISLPAALATAAASSLLLMATNRPELATVPPDTWVALIAIWSMLGVMATAYHPVRQVARWAWEYYRRAHTLLEEARDRKAELEQALDDLAHANLQLTRLNLLAQGLRQSAENARSAKEEFVANVSHELRTPLNMITGFSETILQAPETYGPSIPPALLADLAVIHRNAEHLSALIDDVLNLSQIDAEQMALAKDFVPFGEIVEDATTAVRPLFEAKHLYLKTDVPELPTVYCDRTRIREVLLNLLSNAGRFTDQGGIRLQIRQEKDNLVVAVADSGSGIAADDIDKLFQPFQQLDGSIRRRHGGTGLGLSISKRFIELHGGKIWVESAKDVGTTFFFRLPISPPVAAGDSFLRGLTPDWEYMQRNRSPLLPRPTVTPRFVVLEKGDSLQRLLGRHWDGIEVVAVSGLRQALSELAQVPAQALLVNDVSVSNTLRRLNAFKGLPDGTPAIICSVPGAHGLSAELGVSAHLVKPVSRQALLGALDRLQVQMGTILIVDDEPDALQLFGRMLASAGRDYRILLARNGQEALDVLREHSPDVILLDLVMPQLDGFQLLEVRSQDPDLRRIPVVLVSARDLAGQPIVSSALAVTQGGGLSVRRLLASIEALSKILSTAGPVADPGAPAASSG